jgi:hypothetical protein
VKIVVPVAERRSFIGFIGETPLVWLAKWGLA